MTLYLDSLFMINFVMNYIILLFTGKLVNSKFGKNVRQRRYVIGSGIVTSLYLTIICVEVLRNNFNILYAVILIAIGILITFKPSNLKMFATYLFFTHLVAFTIGGVSFGVFYYTKAGAFLGNVVTATTQNMSLKLLIATTSFTSIAVKIIVRYIESIKLSKQKVLNVKVKGINGEYEELVMLVDTGNTLIEPISKLPVIVIPYFKIKKLLEKELYKLYEEDGDVIGKAFSLEIDFVSKLKLVPFKSVGKENGLLLGFETEITFDDDGYTQTKKCVVGIINIEVSKSVYSSIFNPLLLREDNNYVKRCNS